MTDSTFSLIVCYCIVWYCIALYCIALHRIALGNRLCLTALRFSVRFLGVKWSGDIWRGLLLDNSVCSPYQQCIESISVHPDGNFEERGKFVAAKYRMKW